MKSEQTIQAFPKPRREIDDDYREWIKSHRCLLSSVGCRGPIDPHHVIPKGGGKMGSKVSDRRCVPLCRIHHDVVEANPNGYREMLESAIARYNWRYNTQANPKLKREWAPSVRLKIQCSCGREHRVRMPGLTYVCRGQLLEVKTQEGR